MPTIQFSTDDQTKAASTVLFARLGITMSEAINLFLRQSIMRGGIPFTLTVPPDHETKGLRFAEYAALETGNDEALIDALRRYKAVNHADFDIAKAEPFLHALWGLDSIVEPRLTFYEDAVKARFKFRGSEFVIDYNFEEPQTLFILSRQDGKLFAKDCALADREKTLGLF
ncbi:MAG: type II toxin-antitoxin system RelB/DinJ family antitoxin [Spirochaetia bacterium]|jgi:DNA-damage-inducible protein J|nr:type II toxin-antitoxin system RelB/DinJ family antitoxin [Spirochaetia bacterium]